jgi:hypothetical protein
MGWLTAVMMVIADMRRSVAEEAGRGHHSQQEIQPRQHNGHGKQRTLHRKHSFTSRLIVQVGHLDQSMVACLPTLAHGCYDNHLLSQTLRFAPG